MREHTNFEKKIKRIRKEYGLTQLQFAEWIGVPKQTIANVESGRAEVKDDFLKLIAMAFDVEYEWLKDDDAEINEFYYEYSRDTEFLGRYKNLTKDNQEIVLALMKFLEERQKKFKSKNVKSKRK